MVGHSMNAGMRKRDGSSCTQKLKKGGAAHKEGGSHCVGGTAHKMGGMKYGGKRHTKKASKKSAKNKASKKSAKNKASKKSAKNNGRKSRKSRKSRNYKGGKGCAMANAKGFQSLLQASDTIQGLEAQQKAIQEQKIMAAKQYSDDLQAMKNALARDIQKPGMEVQNALRSQATFGTPQKALAGFGPSTWYRA